MRKRRPNLPLGIRNLEFGTADELRSAIRAGIPLSAFHTRHSLLASLL
jgi:hypothetical protein